MMSAVRVGATSEGAVQHENSRKAPIRLSRGVWIGFFSAVLASVATVLVNEGIKRIFPHTDDAGRVVSSLDGLIKKMDSERDGLIKLATDLHNERPTSSSALNITQAIEVHVNRLVTTSTQVRNEAAESAGLPRVNPPPASYSLAALPAVQAEVPKPEDRRLPTKADLEPDLWIPTFQSTLIGDDKHSFGVQGVMSDGVQISVDGTSRALRAGERVAFSDFDEYCYVGYLRSESIDAQNPTAVRHGFSIVCTPKRRR
jgi:hypothetical protein